MPSFKPDRIKVDGLEQLAKALKKKPPVGRIGVLGGKAQWSKDQGEGKKEPPTNAEIGAAQEYGSLKTGLPSRSFLRMPLSEHLQKEMEESGLIANDDTMKEVLKEQSVVPWLKKVMVCAERVVLRAFDTEGFGKWVPWKTPGYENNTGKILQDTQQLRNSITTDVKE